MSFQLDILIIDEATYPDDWVRKPNYLNYKLLNDQYRARLEKFLTCDELNLLKPVGRPELSEMHKFPTDPLQFKEVFIKISDYLMQHEEEFSLAHMVVEEDPRFEHPRWMSSYAWENETGVKWSVDALHHDVSHREEVSVSSYDGKETTNDWVKAQPELLVGGRKIALYTRTWYEYCKEDINGIIGICDMAIQLKKSVLWSIW